MVITLFTLALLVAGVISAWVAWYARHHRSGPGSHELAVIMLLASTWALALAGESLSTTYFGKVFWTVISYPGNQIVPALFPIFVLRYTQQDRWLTPQRIAALLALPIVSVFMAASNHWHRLLWPTITIQIIDGRAVGFYAHGPWFWVEILYSYALVLFGALALLRAIFRSPHFYSRQTRLLLLASLFPFLVNVVYAFSPATIAGVDLTPLAFTISGVLIAWGIFGYGLFDVAPLARDRLVEIIQEGVLVLDEQNRLIDCNPAAERVFGWEQAPIGQAAPQFWAAHPVLLALCGDTPSLEWAADCDAVGDCTYELTVNLLSNRRRQAAGRIILIRDITERKRSQRQMQLQAAALEAAENGIVITDPQGKILWTNPAFTRLTGYTREDVVGESTRLLKSGAHDEAYYHQLWQTISAGQVWRGEVVNRRKDGSLYYEDMTITPLVRQGQITHFIAIKQDVTTRKQAEEALQNAHLEALEANRLKTQLLANVSHDLRTPMGAIIGYADMLRSGVFGEVTPKQYEAAMEIMDSSNQLLAFVNNLIGQAQMETGKIVLRPQPFATMELLEAARMFGAMQARRKGLAFECDAAPDFPRQLLGDLYWLRQIVSNLVNNAVKFTESGQVSVELLQPDADHWAIWVSDTGIGIPLDAQVAIFDAFRQVDGSITRKFGGSGLGLSIVKELTTLMGGRIELSSDVGRGSTFAVILPMLAKQEKTE